MAVTRGDDDSGRIPATGGSQGTLFDEDEVEKFKEFLDTISPEDFGRAT